jgi:hypothetical protein
MNEQTQTIYTPDEARKLILSGKAHENMVVDGYLYLDGCSNLASLPEGLQVSEYINLMGCTNLTSLPEGLKVGGSLYLDGCTNLTSLPEGLKVGGHLYLDGCTSLTSLPDGLKVGGHLYLEGCTSLTSLPEGLQVGGRLNLNGCTNLRSIPSSWNVPNIGNIDAMILEAIEAGGELNMVKWHTCETTHCRAGWAIHFAGEDGKRLEERFGPAGAGALLYIASGRPVPAFYARNVDALESIKAGAKS